MTDSEQALYEQAMSHAIDAGKLHAFQGMARRLDLTPLRQTLARQDGFKRLQNTRDILYLLGALREDK